MPGAAVTALAAEVEDAGAAVLKALASDTVTASGTCGTVTWTLYDDGELVLEPTSGDEGTLESFSGSGDVPWYSYCAGITSVTVSGTVHAGESLAYMFIGCESLETLDFSGFDTSDVTNMSLMFSCCYSLVSLDLSCLDISSVTDMSEMFSYCESLETLDLSCLDTSSVTDMSHMFFNCESLDTLELSGLDTSSVNDMSGMFCGCDSLKSLDLSGLDTSSVTDMSSMFCGSSLETLDLSGLDTSSVTDMSDMFRSSSLETLDLSGLDTSSVTKMREMFYSCKSLETLDLSGFDTPGVTNMDYMFYNCDSLKTLDLSSFDTSSVKSMFKMFCDCASLKTLDLSSFDTSCVTDMKYMFYNSGALTTVYVSELWSTESLTSWLSMFAYCYSLVGGNGTAYSDHQFGGVEYARIDTDDTPGFFTYKAYEASSGSTGESSGDSDSASASSGTCGTVAWELSDDGELSLAPTSGSSGTLASMSSTDDVPWYSRNGDIVSVSISGTVYGGSGLAYLFYDCSWLTSLDLSGLDTSGVTDMSSMFAECIRLETLDLSGFDTSAVTDMSQMFYRCSSLVTIYVSDLWSTESVTSSEDMFYRCESIGSVSGTAYDSDYTDCTYARIDTSDTPGYLTDISDTIVLDTSELFSSTLYRAAYLLDDSHGTRDAIATDIGFVLDGTTPAQKLLASARENGLSDSATVWDWVTNIGDSVDSISNVADLEVEPYEVYATLIVCILEDSSDANISVPAVAKDAVSLTDELMEQALASVDSSLAEVQGAASLSGALSAEQYEQLQDNIDSMLKNSSTLDATSSLLGAVKTCFEVVDTVSEVADCISACVTLAETSGYIVDVLQQAYENSASGDDAYLTAALSSCIAAMDASTEELYDNIATGAYAVVGTTVAEELLDKLWDGAWTALSAACPAVTVLKTAYKASKLVSNVLFNTDGITEQYARMDALSSIEGVFGTTYSQLMSRAELYSSSEQAAGLYLAAVDLMFMTIDQDCEEAASFVEEIDSATVSKIAQFLGFDDNSAYLAQIASIQEDCYEVWQTGALTMWIGQLELDYPDLYDEYSSLIEEAQNRVATKEYLVACPVDVYVYDASGALVASCVDGKASCSDDANLTLVLDGDEKTVVFYDDAEYTIECVGTDEGTMDVTATEYDDEGAAARTACWYGLALAEGTTYTAAVTAETLSEDGCTLVDASDGGEVEADYDSLTADETTYGFEVVNGIATVAGEPCLSGTAQAGQSVQVAAYVPEGYEFVGWEVTSGADVTFADATETTTTFAMPAGDVQVTAVLQATAEEDAVTDISEAEVTWKATGNPISDSTFMWYIYNGKARTPGVTVTLNGATLKKGTDYTVSYSSNKSVGTAKVTVKGIGAYTGKVTGYFSIYQASNPMKVKKKAAAVKCKKLKAKKRTVKAITVTKAKGKVTYKKKGGSKRLSVNKKTGKITVKKGTKRGTYKIKVAVTASGTWNYAAMTKTVTVKVKVK